jgi:hypothetical protein
VALSFENSSNLSFKNSTLFLTNEFTNFKKQDAGLLSGSFIVPARSVVTFSADLVIGTSVATVIEKSIFNAFHDNLNNEIVATFNIDENIHTIRLFNISGNLLQIKPVESGQNKVVFSSLHLPDGVYIVVGEGNNLKETKKVIISKR